MGKRWQGLWTLVVVLAVGGIVVALGWQGVPPSVVKDFSSLKPVESGESAEPSVAATGNRLHSLGSSAVAPAGELGRPLPPTIPAAPTPPTASLPAPSTEPPVSAPVDPDASENPARPPGAPTASCVAADMADVIAFEPAVDGGNPRTYALSASKSADGPFSVVATATADARSFTVPVAETGNRYYTVSAQSGSGEDACSLIVSNEHVRLATSVSPEGATLRASNGEVVLALPSGSFAETATVTIAEVDGTPVGGIIALAGVYDISASATLHAPVRLSVAYKLAVTHHQVSAALLKGAGLMTYDEATNGWVSQAQDVSADGGYLSGTLSHFSYWTGATIQPHGTTASAVNYCSGVCHDLSPYPGSDVRYTTRDSQICYNCHGSADLSGMPAGAPGENVQGAFLGAWIASRHPVGPGDLYCTVCHDPHANPQSSPGLLRAWDPATGKYVQGVNGTAPGNALCWTCHGRLRNRRVDSLVPWYWTNTGGDKQAAYERSPHGSVPDISYSWSTTADLNRGTVSWGLTASEPGRIGYSSDYSAAGTVSWISNYIVPDVARLDTNTLTWMQSAPAGTRVSVDADVSLDGGVTWLGWQPVSNGGSLPHITPSTDLRHLRVVIRANLQRDGTAGGPYVWNLRWTGKPGDPTHVPDYEKVQEFVGQAAFDTGVYRCSGYYTSFGGVLSNGAWNVSSGAKSTSPTPIVSGSVASVADAPAGSQTVVFGDLTPTGTTITAVIDTKLDDVYLVNAAYVYSGYPTGYGSMCPERVRVEVSMDGVTYTAIGQGGSLGGPSAWIGFIYTPTPARYVRLLIDKYTGAYPIAQIGVGGIEIAGTPVGATYSWTSPPVTIANPREVKVEWYAPVDLAGAVLPTACLSVDGGTTWTDWQSIQYGEELPFADMSLHDTVQVRTRFAVALPVAYDRTALRDVIIWNSCDPATEPVTPGDYSCARCHEEHGSESAGLTKAPWVELCWSCHPSEGTSWQGEAEFQASAHSTYGCAGCHDAHGKLDPATGKAYGGMLINTQAQVCFGCHDNPANSKSGINVKKSFSAYGSTDDASYYMSPVWAMRHNVEDWEQEYLASNLDCSDCHGVHSVSGERTLLDPDDPTQVFTQTVDVPRVMRIPVVADASIVSGSSTPLGATGAIPISATSSILMRFDLSQIPTGAQIVDAAIVLWRPVSGNQIVSAAELKPVGVYRVTESWDEAGVLWDDRGGGLGAWSTPGGATSGTRYSTMGWGAHRIDATAVLADLLTGPDHGVLVRAEDIGVSWAAGATVMDRPSHESGSGPYLEVRYHPVEGPDQGLDSIAYCTRCHGGHFPSGMTPGYRRPGTSNAVPRDVVTSWPASMHGGGTTTPPGPTSNSYRTGGLMRPPYSYGQSEELQCTLCHDPHGSNNVYHLRDTPLLDSFSSAGGVNWAYNQWGSWYMGYWCAQCHVGSTHAMTSNSSCTACHYHGRGGLRF